MLWSWGDWGVWFPSIGRGVQPSAAGHGRGQPDLGSGQVSGHGDPGLRCRRGPLGAGAGASASASADASASAIATADPDDCNSVP